MSQLELEAKLQKCKIPLECYQAEKKELLTLGFDEKQTDRIIIRKSSARTVSAAIENFARLVKLFDHKQITKISAHNGGSKTIKALLSNHDELKDLGFTTEQITSRCR